MEHYTDMGNVEQMVEEAQQLLRATQDVEETHVKAARSRVMAALDGWEEMLARRRSSAMLPETGDVLWEHPYLMSGVALGLGVIIGYFLRRGH